MRCKTWKSHQSIVHRIFFHAICLQRCCMARTALKHKHMASKLNSAVKMMKKSLRNDYLLKKLFVAHFFFNYCTLIFPVAQELPNVRNNWKSHCAWPFQLLCIHTLYLYYKRNLSEYSKTISNNQCRSRFPFNI